MKVLGYNDGVHTCECCGKAGLKGTFGVELDSGEVVHYGSVCVTHHTGKSKAAIVSEVSKREAAQKEAKEAQFRSTFESIQYEAKMAEARRQGLVGKPFKEFCAISRAVADTKRAEIFG